MVTNTEVVNNTAASSYTHKGAGGGIAVSASALLTMSEGCRLEGNVAGPEVQLLVGVDWLLLRTVGPESVGKKMLVFGRLCRVV